MPLRVPPLDYERGVPIYRQIFEAVVAALGRGELAADEQLPTIVQLARQLEVNPNTVARAYRDLEREGYLVAQRGRGTFPAPQPRPEGPDRHGLLRAIVERALGECARHGLGRDELLEFLKAQRA